jgi:hypothetical protein
MLLFYSLQKETYSMNGIVYFTQTEGVWEQGAEENIWTQEGW